MPPSTELLKMQLDTLKELLGQLSERVIALEKNRQQDLQWANGEHWKIHQEIAEQGKRTRDDLIMEGKDMRTEVQSDIQEIKELMKSQDNNGKQTMLTLVGPVASAILLIVVDVILHAMHVI